MSDHIDTRDGWRKVTAAEYGPFSRKARLVEFGDDGRPKTYWVRGEPVPALPTEPYTVIRVTWSPSYGRANPTSVLVKQDGHGWYGDGYAGVAEVLRRDIAGFEVLAEPRSVTAKAVLDEVLEIGISNDGRGVIRSEIRAGVADIARKFGVKS